MKSFQPILVFINIIVALCTRPELNAKPVGAELANRMFCPRHSLKTKNCQTVLFSFPHDSKNQIDRIID